MKHLFLTVAFTASILLASYMIAIAKINSAMLPQKVSLAETDTLKKYLKGFPINTQLSIAIVENDKVVYTGIITDKDSFHIVENRDSIFEIGSLSKVFTSI